MSETWQVMRERHDPLPLDGTRQDDLLRGERVERKEILRGDPRQGQMVPIGHEVGGEEERLLAVADSHRLRAAGVALDAVEPDARDDLDGLVDEVKLARGLERRGVIG